MKTILRWGSLGLGIVLSGACQKSDDPTGAVTIRVRNESPYRLENVYVNTSGGENSYGTVESGQNSSYQSFERAYRYAYVTFTVNGKPLALLPIDYMGETPLSSGRHTYVLGVADLNAGYATLRLE